MKKLLKTVVLGTLMSASLVPLPGAQAGGYPEEPPRLTAPSPPILDLAGRLDPAVCEYAIKLLKTKPEDFYVGPLERECLKRYLEGQLEGTEPPAQPQQKAEATQEQEGRRPDASPDEKKTAEEIQMAGQTPSEKAGKETEDMDQGNETGEILAGAENLANQADNSNSTGGLPEKEPEFQNPKPLTATLKPGYLSQNLARILNDLGWKTPPGWWDTPRDYLVVSEYAVEGKDIYDLFAKLLKPYRLKAKFFLWDKTVRILAVESGS